MYLIPAINVEKSPVLHHARQGIFVSTENVGKVMVRYGRIPDS